MAQPALANPSRRPWIIIITRLGKVASTNDGSYGRLGELHCSVER